MNKNKDIFEVLAKPKNAIHVLDVGAMSFGLHTEPYSELQKLGLCKVTGFEPVKKECDKLNVLYPDDCFLPYCIGDGSHRKFFLTNSGMTSSLYEPNIDLLKQFENLPAAKGKVLKKFDILYGKTPEKIILALNKQEDQDDNERLSITIKMKNPISPLKLGHSQDQRLLGLKLNSIRVFS